MGDQVIYRQYIIERNWTGNSMPDTWTGVHEGYDGPEDGRAFCSKTLEGLISEIDEWDDEE
jgi:hypothetical protein